MHAESADGLAEQVEVTKRAEVNLNRRIQALLDHRCSTLNVAPIADSTAQLKDWAPKTVQENLAPCFSSHKVTCRSKPKSEVPRSPSSGPLSVFEDVSNEETEVLISPKCPSNTLRSPRKGVNRGMTPLKDISNQFGSPEAPPKSSSLIQYI
jgi:hypothetical protein